LPMNVGKKVKHKVLKKSFNQLFKQSVVINARFLHTPPWLL
jgi:hypothetical protein